VPAELRYGGRRAGMSRISEARKFGVEEGPTGAKNVGDS